MNDDLAIQVLLAEEPPLAGAKMPAMLKLRAVEKDGAAHAIARREQGFAERAADIIQTRWPRNSSSRVKYCGL